MATITQTVPSYVQGISTQPDELKLPGQVRDVTNAIPDVAKGLVKRPGSRLIAPLEVGAAGKWFTIDRDGGEQYMVNIKDDGSIFIWSTLDGAQMPVFYSATPPNLQLNDITDSGLNLAPAPIPDDWQEPDYIPTELPPVTPTPGDDTAPGDPLYPGCDNTLYAKTLKQYRDAYSVVQKKETELQVLNSKLNLLEKQYKNKIEYYSA